VVAVTGTNGKTSSAWWTAQALGMLDRPCGLVGTLGVGTRRCRAGRRPHPLHRPDHAGPGGAAGQLCRHGPAGLAACAIEASSIGIAEERMAGTRIAVALFTNFTRDHLDYHGDMAPTGPRSAAVRLGRPEVRGDQCGRPAGRAGGRAGRQRLDLWTVSAQGEARIQAREVGYTAQGLRFLLAEAGGEQDLPVQTGLIGQYNISNLLGVIGGLRALGVPLTDAALSPTTSPRCRAACSAARRGQPEVVVDYAHTPDAGQRPSGAAPHGPGPWRPALVRVRLRRRPRRHQAPADGRHRPAPGRPRGRHQRQPAP
jgi:UDP-N-acetylmuramoyl-L-alanyl-D-glutamate--2,6-diaminopimelate ligase